MCTKTEDFRVTLTGTGVYQAKDQAKSDLATKFIGRGSPKSSTARYAKDWGARANSGEYNEADTVFISAEGNRWGRLDPDAEEIQKAMAAKARFITDNRTHRQREYNIGERQVALILSAGGYEDPTNRGLWVHPIYHKILFKKD